MKIRLRKTLLVMKFLCFFFLLSVSVSAASYSQNARFTLTLENVALTDVFSTIRKSSEFTFIYNMDDVRNIRGKGSRDSSAATDFDHGYGHCTGCER